MTTYFGAAGYPCPQFSNPSDFVLSLVNTDFPGHGDMAMLEAGYDIPRPLHPPPSRRV